MYHASSIKNLLSIRLATLAACLTFFALQTATALAYGYGWDINSFDADIIIREDGIITVTENIVADYTSEPHHGIIRSIPVDYRDRYGNKLSLHFEITSVTDENGQPWTYEQYRSGDILNLKIGDPDLLLSEPSTFKITYNVGRAINRFDTYDELYWNATGTQWDVAMNKVSATVHLPQKIADKDIKSTCFTGGYGSTQQDCKSEISNHTVKYEVAGLPAFNGLTIVVGFPKGIVAQASLQQQTTWFLLDNWGYALPLLTFAGLYYLWHSRGRDPKTEKDTIMPIYKAPPGLTPTEAGTIIDEHLDIRDITSAIVDLAIRGYLRIVEKKEKKFLFESTDYTFEKIKPFENDITLKDHERKMLQAIFDSGDSRMLSDLKNKFYKDLPDIREAVYKRLITDGYFPTNPEKVRNIYYTIGFIILGGIFFGLGAWIEFLSLSAIVGLGASGILFLAFARFMPAKTKKGVEIYYQIKGLEEYIKTAEKDRIKFQERETSTLSKESVFEKLLPYALTLGLATKWAQAFEGVYKTAPSWYVSSNPHWHSQFNAIAFTDQLNSVASEMQTTFASSPRSAAGGGSGFSGGFSGGGFGGGGGSSW